MPAPLSASPHRAGPQRRELLLAALLAGLWAALALWDGLLGLGTSAFLAADTATVAEPWSALIDSAVARPRHPDLSDQGVVFYPTWTWVLESLSAGDFPLWNPLIYAGAPALGNPQAGVLDPQLLVLWPLWHWGGAGGLHVGLFLLAWLRLFSAAFGAYWLARRLGLSWRGAGLAGLGFAASGYLVLWLNHPLSHVTPCLPWLLLGIEGCAGSRPGRAALGTCVVAALAILGGHPETSFYVGAAAGAWALGLVRHTPRAGLLALAALLAGALLAAPVWWPFLEYLSLSSAQAIRAAAAESSGLDLVSLGALLVALALGRICTVGPAEDSDRASSWRRAAGLAALLLGLLALLVARGLPEGGQLTLFADRFGRPGAGGYRGPGIYLEQASTWLCAPVLGLALASLFSRQGQLPRRGLALLLGFGALALALRTPGLLELKQRLPVVGLGATVRLAAVSGLFLSLLAGEALEQAGRTARRAAALVLGAVGLGILLWPALQPGASAGANAASAQASSDGLVGFLHLPPARIEAASADFEGWLDPGLPDLRAALLVQRIEPPGIAGAPLELGGSFELPLELYQAPRNPEEAAQAPAGARFFRSEYLQTNRLGPGLWAFDLLLYLEGQGTAHERRAALCVVGRPRPEASIGWLLWGLGLLALCLPMALGTPLALLTAALGGLWFAQGLNPAIPEAEVFPLTQTEAFLQKHQGSGRFFGDPGVFPPDTGLVRGLRALDGYDGLDPAAYNQFRPMCLQPGVQGLLGWNARGVELEGGPFRLFGVNHLVLKEPAQLPGFELVAAPDGSTSQRAETYIYRARDPLPNARLVGASLPTAGLRDLLAAGGSWDPRTSAAYDGDFKIQQPFSNSKVEERSRGNNHIELDVELDGDGLLCLAEQHFPGWRVTVDGERAPLERVNAIFRGVGLHAGQHRVRFDYWPTHLTRALLLSAAGLCLALWLSRRSPPTRA